jgi:phage terminase large subunit
MKIQQKPIEIAVAYDPLPKQAEFHGCNARFRAFGGGFGNGKTAAGCAEAFFLAMEYPGSVGLICRATRPELHATTQHVFFNGGGGKVDTDWTGIPQELIRNFNKTQNRLEMINGSIIWFWPLDDPAKLTNINLGWFLIDQAEETTEEMFLMLIGRLRQRGAPRKGMILFNPNGHDWIWKRWVRDEMKNHVMVHAKTTDNPNLPRDYMDAFEAYPDAWKKRFMEGSFEVFTDQIWPEFDEDVHVVNPFPIPPWFEVVEGIDHGRRNPTAVLWSAFDDQGNVFFVDEHYEAGRLVGHHATAINKRREQSWGIPNYTVIDASASQKDPNTGRSVIDEYYDYGIITLPSDRHKIARVNRVAEWLRRDPNHPHPLTGEYSEEGYPRLYIFRNCVNLIEHVPQYKWKPLPPTAKEDAKEEPLKKDDHDVDAMGYILMTRPRPAERPIDTKTASDQRSQKYWDKYHRRGGHKIHSKLGAEA